MEEYRNTTVEAGKLSLVSLEIIESGFAQKDVFYWQPLLTQALGKDVLEGNANLLAGFLFFFCVKRKESGQGR